MTNFAPSIQEFIMIYQDKIEPYLELIRDLEKVFSEAQTKEILPLSFFSSSIDILNSLKIGVYEIEALQLQMMQEHIKEVEDEIDEEDEINEIKELDEIDELNEVKGINKVNILADTIGRKMIPDFEKSVSLNDRFMVQRDLLKKNDEDK